MAGTEEQEDSLELGAQEQGVHAESSQSTTPVVDSADDEGDEEEGLEEEEEEDSEEDSDEDDDDPEAIDMVMVEMIAEELLSTVYGRVKVHKELVPDISEVIDEIVDELNVWYWASAQEPEEYRRNLDFTEFLEEGCDHPELKALLQETGRQFWWDPINGKYAIINDDAGTDQIDWDNAEEADTKEEAEKYAYFDLTYKDQEKDSDERISEIKPIVAEPKPNQVDEQLPQPSPKELINRIFAIALDGDSKKIGEAISSAINLKVDLSAIFSALFRSAGEAARLYEEGEYFVPEILINLKAVRVGIESLLASSVEWRDPRIEKIVAVDFVRLQPPDRYLEFGEQAIVKQLLSVSTKNYIETSLDGLEKHVRSEKVLEVIKENPNAILVEIGILGASTFCNSTAVDLGQIIAQSPTKPKKIFLYGKCFSNSSASECRADAYLWDYRTAYETVTNLLGDKSGE